jgi:hypothetical protein
MVEGEKDVEEEDDDDDDTPLPGERGAPGGVFSAPP